MKKFLLILVGTGLTLSALAYGWWAWHKHETDHLAYTLSPVERGTLEDIVSASGLVRPREVYIVGSDLSGKAVAVLADYNQTVAEGDVLGWSWLFPPYRWVFDAQALELTRALVFDGTCLRGKCEDDHNLGYELMKRFAHVVVQRLQATRLQLLDVYGILA